MEIRLELWYIEQRKMCLDEGYIQKENTENIFISNSLCFHVFLSFFSCTLTLKNHPYSTFGYKSVEVLQCLFQTFFQYNLYKVLSVLFIINEIIIKYYKCYICFSAPTFQFYHLHLSCEEWDRLYGRSTMQKGTKTVMNIKQFLNSLT